MINKINVTLPNEFGAPAWFQVVPANWLPDRLAMIVLDREILGWLELSGDVWKVSYLKSALQKEQLVAVMPTSNFSSNNAVGVWACREILKEHFKIRPMKAGDSIA